LDLASIRLKTECDVYVLNATLLVSFDIFLKENSFYVCRQFKSKLFLTTFYDLI